MKRIGILIDRLNVGGVEKIAIEQVKALRRIGEDATLVVLRRKGVVDDAFSDLRIGVPTIYLDDRLPSILRFSFQFPVFHFFSSFHLTYPLLIPFVVRPKEFDYLICHGTYTAFSAIPISKLRHIPVSTFIWDPISYIVGRVYKNKLAILFGPIRSFALILDRWIVRNSRYVLVGGDAHDSALSDMGARIRHIYPSVYPAAGISAKKNAKVLMITAWKRAKNPDYIFEILRHIPALSIDMVGKWLEPEFLKEFQEKVRANGYAKNITIVGGVSEKQLQIYYKKSLVFLQTNDDRGFGLPALEAAGNGTPFIIPKGQGVCKLFKNGKEGYFVTERDTKSICAYLRTLLRNNRKAIAMGKTAWKTVKEHYSWDHHAQKLVWVVLH